MAARARLEPQDGHKSGIPGLRAGQGRLLGLTSVKIK